MRKILVLVMVLFTVNATAQWTVNGQWLRLAGRLGIPVKDTTSANNVADSAQIVLKPQDSTLYFKYKGYWRTLAAASTIDSLVYSTRAWRQKGLDSLAGAITLQKTLTNGATLSQSNTIDADGNNLTIQDVSQFIVTGSDSVRIASSVVNLPLLQAGAITDSLLTWRNGSLRYINPSRVTSTETLATVTGRGNSTTDSINVVAPGLERIISLYGTAAGPGGRVPNILLRQSFDDAYSIFNVGSIVNKLAGGTIRTYSFPDASGTIPISVNSQTANSSGAITLTAANVGALGTGDSLTSIRSNFTSIGRAYKIADSLANGVFWRLGGNSTTAGFGSRIGTTGNTTLRLIANGQEVAYIDSLTRYFQIGGQTYTYAAPLQTTSTVSGPVGFNTGLTLRGAAPMLVFEDSNSDDFSFGVDAGRLNFYSGAGAATGIARFANGGFFFGGTSNAAASALVEISSTASGLLIPRMTNPQRNAISSPANHLLIANTTTGRMNYYDGTNTVFGWRGMVAEGNGGINKDSVANSTSINLSTLMIDTVNNRLVRSNGGAYTGWTTYRDSTLKRTSPYTISQDSTRTLPFFFTSSITTQMPLDYDSMFSRTDTGIIIKSGDGFIAKIEFAAKTSTGSNKFVQVDLWIGGTMGSIYSQLLPIRGTSWQNLTVTITGFAGATFAANKGKVRLTAFDGDIQIGGVQRFAGNDDGVSITIQRTHKAR